MIKKVNSSTLISSFVDVFYPKYCCVCSDHLTTDEEHICLRCHLDLPLFEKDQHEFRELNGLFDARVPVDNIYSLFRYEKGNNVQSLLGAIKYKGRKKMAVSLGNQLGTTINSQVDFILPIPLHPKKERQRGYNQSHLIAKGISNAINTPIAHNLKRTKNNKSQTAYSKYDRWDNVRSIFKLIDSQPLIRKHLLIVDDVLTTGATIESAAIAVLNEVDCTISVATLAARI